MTTLKNREYILPTRNALVFLYITVVIQQLQRSNGIDQLSKENQFRTTSRADMMDASTCSNYLCVDEYRSQLTTFLSKGCPGSGEGYGFVTYSGYTFVGDSEATTNPNSNDSDGRYTSRRATALLASLTSIVAFGIGLYWGFSGVGFRYHST